VIGLSESDVTDVFLGETSVFLGGAGFLRVVVAFVEGVAGVLCDLTDSFLRLTTFFGGVAGSVRGICLGFLDFGEARGILMGLEGFSKIGKGGRSSPLEEGISSNSRCCR
jgi:hypothetical protein